MHNVYNFLWHQGTGGRIAKNYPMRAVLLSPSGLRAIIGLAWDMDDDTGRGLDNVRGALECDPAIWFVGLETIFGTTSAGFTGTPTDELYVRWFQFGAFCPVFRAHGVDSKPVAPYEFRSVRARSLPQHDEAALSPAAV